MKWVRRNDTEKNFEDRRGRMPKKGAAIGGIGAIIIAVIALLLGQDPFQALDTVGGMSGGQQTEEVIDPERATENEELKIFTLGVFNSSNDVWREIFRKQLNTSYEDPILVTYTDQTTSACGGANAQIGPFYCPGDNRVYIDLDFFHQLTSKYGATGDLAMAYVTAHEVGHHVQRLLGILDQVQKYRSRVSEVEYNKLNVKLELQADFFAGVWANQAQKMGIIALEPGDLESAMSATNAIGDDTLQKNSMGYTVPDSFTHGTAAQRSYWFKKGFQTGDVNKGDTFNDPSLN